MEECVGCADNRDAHLLFGSDHVHSQYRRNETVVRCVVCDVDRQPGEAFLDPCEKCGIEQWYCCEPIPFDFIPLADWKAGMKAKTWARFPSALN